MVKGYHKGKPYNDDDFKKIERSLEKKTKLSEKHRVLLNMSKRKWETCKVLLPERVPTSEQSKQDNLKKIDDLKGRIAELIGLLEADSHLIESPHYSCDRLMDDLFLALRFVEAAQKKEGKPSGKKIPAQQGRTPQNYRSDFILVLAKIYKKITGEEPATPAFSEYKGEYTCKNSFYNFVVTCVQPIEKIPDVTLGSAIIKSIKTMQKMQSISVTRKTGEPNKNQIFPKDK